MNAKDLDIAVESKSCIKLRVPANISFQTIKRQLTEFRNGNLPRIVLHKGNSSLERYLAVTDLIAEIKNSEGAEKLCATKWNIQLSTTTESRTLYHLIERQFP